MDKQAFPPLSAFDGPDVEHVAVWTTPRRSTSLEILPHHKQAIYSGDLQIEEAPRALVLERSA